MTCHRYLGSRRLQTRLYMRAWLKTSVLVPSRPTPRVSSIILLLLLITPSVSWLALKAWMAAPKLSVIPWKGNIGSVSHFISSIVHKPLQRYQSSSDIFEMQWRREDTHMQWGHSDQSTLRSITVAQRSPRMRKHTSSHVLYGNAEGRSPKFPKWLNVHVMRSRNFHNDLTSSASDKLVSIVLYPNILFVCCFSDVYDHIKTCLDRGNIYHISDVYNHIKSCLDRGKVYHEVMVTFRQWFRFKYWDIEWDIWTCFTSTGTFWGGKWHKLCWIYMKSHSRGQKPTVWMQHRIRVE